jgi:hypothetical protein
MICDCGGETKVMQTMPIKDVIKRRRKCMECKKLIHTLEVRATVQELEDIEPPPKPKPLPPMARVAKVVNKKRVDARRVNEDRRSKVPSYFIEDDDY